jgi:multiple sugar transport system substrate-binding protein
MMGNDKYSSVVSHMEELSNKNLKFNLDCIRKGLINQYSSGNVYMVPVFSRTYGMLVNNDLFKKEGITIPSTWDTLVSTSLSFKDKGYVSPIMRCSRTPSSCFMNTIAYPLFVAALEKNPSALALANDLNPSAGEYMRDSLKAVTDLVDKGCINLEECDKIEEN